MGSSDDLDDSSNRRVISMGVGGVNFRKETSSGRGVVPRSGRPMLEALIAASKALNAGEVVQCPLLLSFELFREHQIYRERGEDDCLPQVDPRRRKAQTSPIVIKEAAHDLKKEAAASAAVVIRIMLRDGLRDLGRRVVVRNVEASTYCGYHRDYKKSQITLCLIHSTPLRH